MAKRKSGEGANVNFRAESVLLEELAKAVEELQTYDERGDELSYGTMLRMFGKAFVMCTRAERDQMVDAMREKASGWVKRKVELERARRIAERTDELSTLKPSEPRPLLEGKGSVGGSAPPRDVSGRLGNASPKRRNGQKKHS